MYNVSLSNFYKELNYFILDDGINLRFCGDDNHKYNQHLSKPVSAFDSLIDKLIFEVESDIDHVISRHIFGSIETLKLLEEVILIRGLGEQPFNQYKIEFADKKQMGMSVRGRFIVRWSKEKIEFMRLKKLWAVGVILKQFSERLKKQENK